MTRAATCPYRAAYDAGGYAFTPGTDIEDCGHPALDSSDRDIVDNFRDGWHDAACDRACYLAGGFADRR